MGFPWKQVAHIGLGVVGQIVPAVGLVEQLSRQFGNLHGKEKQDAVAELARQSLMAAEGLTGRNLANDADVDRAIRTTIDAVVALHNVIGVKAAAGV